MKEKFPAVQCIVFAILVGATSAAAQSPGETSNPSFDSVRVEISYRGALNVSAKFKNLGSFPPQSNPGPSIGGGVDRFYDDGFNRVDASGNSGGLTSFWGYQHARQVPGNDTIVMNSSSVTSGTTSAEESQDPQHGFEITCDIPVGRSGRWQWGLEGAFGISDLTFRDDRILSGNVARISDAFVLNGITPPVPPYAGPYNGPGSLIGDSPTRTTVSIPGGAMITGQRKLDAVLYELRLGPYFEVPLSKRLSFSLSGGAAVARVESAFEFSDTAAMADIGTTLSVSGRDSDGEFLFGGFVGAKLSVAVTEHLNILTGVQYQYLPDFLQSANNREAGLDLGKSIFFTAGVGFTF